jgi:hypothetical protein
MVFPHLRSFFGKEIKKFNVGVKKNLLILESTLNAVMTHFVRAIESGVELRTRFWIGYQIDVNKKPVKVLPEGVIIPEFVPKALINHCAKEFAHLAKILAPLYEEEKLNFSLYKVLFTVFRTTDGMNIKCPCFFFNINRLET